VVYARELDGQVLTLIVSGKLWRNSLIMMDEESGSLWSHVTGECLEGEHAGRSLRRLPSVQTTWAAWRDAHPGTRVLKKSAEILSSRYERYFADQDRAGMFRSLWLHDRMPAKALVHGVTDGPHALAVRDDVLAPGDGRTVDLAGRPVRLVRDRDGGVRAYAADGGELPVFTAFWFAWSSFHPNTAVVGD
jgi:hypothetical protein